MADDHLVDVHVANLRRKLGDDPAHPRFVETVRGVGYRLARGRLMAFPRSLRARLLLAFLVVVGATLGTVAVATLLVGPGYFAEAMGHLPGDPMGEAMGAATQAAFEEAMQRALVAATVIAIVSAAVVSLAVAARIAGPVGTMAAAARRVAGGHYAERVPVAAPDELGELADSFNEMAGSLEATERRRLQLVGDVAHELRTPLTTLDGYLEGLEDGVIAPSDATWRLLRAETGRLTRLVNDLSELWRAEARQLPLRIEAVDVAAVAGEVVDRFRLLAAPRGIDLELARRTALRLGPTATASPRCSPTTCRMRCAMRRTARSSP